MTGEAAVSMLAKAFKETQRVRQNWLGPEHYLLAVLAEPSIATDLMAELGVTHERLATRLGSMRTVNGRRSRYIESRGATTNPAAHDVSGWAAGFAAASGRRDPTPEDWLLAIFYADQSMTMSVMHEFGVSAGDVVDAARRRGISTPDFEPEEHRPWRNPRGVEVDKSEWQAVVDLLGRKYGPGSDLRWGFNSRKDRPRKVEFRAEEGIDLEAIVAEARVQAKPG
jgi:ATP-dependent Clp protease ATP-binding subunit ClpA